MAPQYPNLRAQTMLEMGAVVRATKRELNKRREAGQVFLPPFFPQVGNPTSLTEGG